MTSSASAIDAQGVTKVFQGSGAADLKALDDVSVTIRQNEFFTLLGPSGCGKTTLLRLIAGFEFPTEGTIRLYGRDIALLPPYLRPVNTVFQSYALFPHLTVGQNIGFGLEMQDRPKREVAARVAEMLRLVRMEDLKDRLTSRISGGQQQRVALARALAPQPKVLLLDEPLSALDYKLRKEMQIELKRLQLETGITFIFVTHDQEEALTMSDRIAVMSKGRILQVGTPRDIYDRPEQRFVADFIGEANLMAGEITAATADEARVLLASGASITATLPAEARPTGKVTVMVRPEHAEIVADAKDATLRGILERTVYFGTDTHFNIMLADGTPFVVRRQNDRKQGKGPEPGSAVGVQLAERVAQVLRD